MRIYMLHTLSSNYTILGYCGSFSTEELAIAWIAKAFPVYLKSSVIFNGQKITTITTKDALYSIVEDELQ